MDLTINAELTEVFVPGGELPPAPQARVLTRLECDHQVRPSHPGENIEYNACRHDYTLCSNQYCIKKLV